MKGFLKVLLFLALMFVTTLAGGGVLLLIAKFGHLAVSYRAACAVSLLMSYWSVRNTDWKNREEVGLSENIISAATEILAACVFSGVVLLVWAVMR